MPKSKDNTSRGDRRVQQCFGGVAIAKMSSDKDIRDSSRHTALAIARKNGYKDIIKVLTGDVSADSSIVFWGDLDLSDNQFDKRLSTLPSNYKCIELLLYYNKLSNCNLTNRQFSTLSTIKICHNQLTEIDGFPNTITYLDASNNHITFVKSVPSSLTTCLLENNPITTLKSNCFKNENISSVLTKALTDEQIGKLIQPPPGVFRQGHISIQQYFQDITLGQVVETSSSSNLTEVSSGKDIKIDPVVKEEKIVKKYQPQGSSEYMDYGKRLRSLMKWKQIPVEKEKVAGAGLYYIEDDKVTCPMCLVTIENWKKGDKPDVRHFVGSPRCPFIIKHFKLETKRLETFKDWQDNFKAKPEELAKIGFVYIGPGDNVQCVYCWGKLSEWVEGDTEEAEHRRCFPMCPTLKAIKTNVI